MLLKINTEVRRNYNGLAKIVLMIFSYDLYIRFFTSFFYYI